LKAILGTNGFDPMWDEYFAFGHGFHDQIRNFVAHAHVFLPVLTATSDQRKWVHQEIGYAMTLNVPVLPVAVGTAGQEAMPGDQDHRAGDQQHPVRWQASRSVRRRHRRPHARVMTGV
jgi:hypothetical protein